MSDLTSRRKHPNCSICGVPMWLVKVDLGEIAEAQEFECQVCDRKVRRTVPVEQHA